MAWFYGAFGQIAHLNNPLKTYLIDSFPVPVCHNIRIKRCKIYNHESYRGWNESKKEYFYGLKVHLLVSETGIPVEIVLSTGNYSDTSSVYDFSFSLPENSYVHGDKAYNVYEVEDQLCEEKKINFMPIRKKNSKRNYEFVFARVSDTSVKKLNLLSAVYYNGFPNIFTQLQILDLN